MNGTAASEPGSRRGFRHVLREGFIRAHRIPDRHVVRDADVREPASTADLERVARSFVIDRSFAWRQSSLRMIQIQLLGICVCSIALVLGRPTPGVVLLVGTTVWVLVHERLGTLDRRHQQGAFETDPVGLGLRVAGGFGALDASYAHRILNGVDGHCEPDEGALEDAAQRWREANLSDRDRQETFTALAPEFSGSAEELLRTCDGLLSS